MTITPATETGVIAYWLDSVLRADSTLVALARGGIYHRKDLSGSKTYPKVFFNFLGGSDLNALGAGRRVFVNAIYGVRGELLQNDDATILDPLAARFDFLLNGKSAAVPGGGEVLACARIYPIETDGIRDGIPITIKGGAYRIWGQITT